MKNFSYEHKQDPMGPVTVCRCDGCHREITLKGHVVPDEMPAHVCRKLGPLGVHYNTPPNEVLAAALSSGRME